MSQVARELKKYIYCNKYLAVTSSLYRSTRLLCGRIPILVGTSKDPGLAARQYPLFLNEVSAYFWQRWMAQARHSYELKDKEMTQRFGRRRMAVLVTSALEFGSDDERELNPETKRKKRE